MANSKPTEAELSILAVLWREGPSSVQSVHRAIRSRKAVGYTTILKLLQIMLKKGLVLRDESSRVHVYRAGVAQSRVQGQLLSELIKKAFAGSASRLALHALSTRKTTREERDEIRRILREADRREDDAQ